MEVKEMDKTHDTSEGTRILGGRYSQRQQHVVARIRVAVAIWLVVLAGIFCSRGYDWGLALLAPAALHVWLACRLRGTVHGQH
jgi:hypothetical protein